jgi:hypothetical protein
VERRLTLAAGAVLLAVSSLPAGPAAATAPSVRLAPGVVLTHSSFTLAGAREQAVTITVSLSAKTRLVAAAPGDVIGARRATTLALGRQHKAVAGINGDVFYLSDPTAVPRGGLTTDGRLLKSALVGKKAALYVTASGRAAIGDPGFAGTVRTADGRHGYKIRSVNSLENARNGAVTITDRRLLGAKLPGCTQVDLAATATAGQYQVGAVRRKVTTYVRRAGAARALVACSAAAGAWLTGNLVPGALVTVRTGYAVGRVRTLISGARVLVARGRRYDDRTGLTGYGNQRKPETFACVFKGGRRLLLGVVEGGRPGAAGVTYGELTTYLLDRGCWSALVLDGSHSATLVAKRPGRHLAVENHPTNPGGAQRAVVDGLFVVTH